jgi:hypothetical protein
VNNTSADERMGGAVFCPPDQQIYCTTFEVVANCMAGIAGERINRKKPGKLGSVDILMGAEGDWQMAQHFIRESSEKGLSKWVITDEDVYMLQGSEACSRSTTSVPQCARGDHPVAHRAWATQSR